MVQILLNEKIYTVDGDDALLLREAVAKLVTESTDAKTKLDNATVQVSTLTAEKTAIETKAATTEAELTATKTKLDEANTQLTQKTDAADVDYDELIKDRLELWSSVMPVLRQDDESFTPDYKLDPLHIKLTYLMKACADKAEVIKGLQSRSDALKNGDQAAIAYVDAMYTAFPPDSVRESQPSHTDNVLESILFARHFNTDSEAIEEGVRTGKVAKMDHREELRKKMESKNPDQRKAKTS